MGLFVHLLTDMCTVIHYDMVFNNKKQHLLMKGWMSDGLPVRRNTTRGYKRRQLCANWYVKPVPEPSKQNRHDAQSHVWSMRSHL